ncbi:MAG TPA: PEP/pyruvate-binding domain-containing protein [Acidimicrobiales bacterium]|nr:PEP/pyruvate-binding domain-containing protein [Acidimicrobiales bacterium]
MVPLAEAADASLFGGKAAHLAVAATSGLPVPPGFALPWPMVEAVAAGDDRSTLALTEPCARLGGPLVVRSSAVGEDSGAASFAGQHTSVLGVGGLTEVLAAVRQVWESASTDAAVAYRRRLGLPGTVRVGAVVQRLVDAEVAGVLFDVNPVTGADEVVVESSWGLGEAVVGGLVTPDFFRLGPVGEVRERRLGVKDVEVRPAPEGGTRRVPVEPGRARSSSLSDPQLRELHSLALRCQDVYGGSQDIEWAFAGGELWLLQRRPLTVPPGGGTGTDG